MPHSQKSTIPRPVLALSVAALAVPLLASVLMPGSPTEGLGLLAWIPAIIPGFLLSYHRGWRGGAAALAAAVVAVALSTLVLALRGLPMPNGAVAAVVIAGYLVVFAGHGFVTELLKRERKAAEDQALNDAQTGLPNRRHAEIFLHAAVSSSRSNALPITLVAFELDQLAWLHDAHGEAASDEVLGTFADLLRVHERPQSLYARIGPEQFLAVLGDTDGAQARQLADTVRADLAALDLRWRPLTVSAGVAELGGSLNTAAALLNAAEEALALAKGSGTDRVALAEGEEPAQDGPEVEPSEPAGWIGRAAARGLVVLPGSEERRSVRRVLELNGLQVEEFAAASEVPNQLGDTHAPIAAVVAAAPDASGVAATLQELERAVGAEVPGVVFVRDLARAQVPLLPGALRLIHGQPSGDRLLPLLAGLLARPVDEGGQRARRAEERGSPLSRDDAPLTAGRVTVVDDQRSNRIALRRILENLGFEDIEEHATGPEALTAMAERPPDLVILDLHMPGMDGLEVLEAMRPTLQTDGFLPVLVVTGDQQWQFRQRALSMGAKDFLNKPFDVSELGARVLNLMQTRRLHLQMRDTNLLLERRVFERTRELAQAKDEILFRLAQAAEYRDDVTGRHAVRVGQSAALLAEAFGLSESRCDVIRRAAPLHDVGKIAIPDAILLKPGPLTEHEVKVMQSHTTIGGQLLTDSMSDVIEEARVIALTHHERWDGAGYPAGLRGEAIPLEGRIVALVDALDALTHARPYKVAASYEEAEARLVADTAIAFDPQLVEALQDVREPMRLLMAEGA